METFRCNACAGEYRNPGAGGLLYFHACPPLSEAEAIPDAVRNAARVLADAGKSDAEVRAVIQSAPEFRSVGKPRPDARNENIRQLGPDSKVEILAEGKGRTEV
jgi:hypothetical protein